MMVRFAQLDDVDPIRTLVNKMISEVTDSAPVIDRSNSIERATRNREILVAEENGHVVGFIHGVLHEDIIDGAPNFFITSFFVLADHRSAGIGSDLLDASIDYAIRNHATEIETSTFSRDARRLFERFGFIQRDGEVFLELDSHTYMGKSRRSA